MPLTNDLRPAQTLDGFNRGGEPREPAKPNHGLWLYYLYLRPRRFFEFFVIEHFPVLTWVCAIMLGFGSAAGQLDQQLSRVNAAQHPMVDSWGVYYLIAAPLSLLSAALYMSLGAWWYAKRLSWCGADGLDRPLVRRVYVYASTVASLPVLLVAVWKTNAYATPLESIAAPLAWPDLIEVGAMCWSAVTSYIGVRTTFGVRGFLTALWFLILPLAIYLVILLLALLTLVLAPVAPNLSSPSAHAAGAIAFKYPSNWTVETSDPNYQRDRYVVVTTPQDCDLVVLVNEHGIGADEVLDESIAQVRTKSLRMRQHADFSSLGRWAGRGVEFREQDGLYTYITTVFVTTLPDGRAVELWQNYEIDDLPVVQPGYMLIVDSLAVGAFPVESPVMPESDPASP